MFLFNFIVAIPCQMGQGPSSGQGQGFLVHEDVDGATFKSHLPVLDGTQSFPASSGMDTAQRGKEKISSISSSTSDTLPGQPRNQLPMHLYVYSHGEQGVRPTMEDVHVTATLTTAPPTSNSSGASAGSNGGSTNSIDSDMRRLGGRWPHIALLCVLDGHGGIDCAKWVSSRLAASLSAKLDELASNDSPNGKRDAYDPTLEDAEYISSGLSGQIVSNAIRRGNILVHTGIVQAVTSAMTTLDKQWLTKHKGASLGSGPSPATSGATCSLVLIDCVYGTLLQANIGDAQCVLSRASNALCLSKLHKPDMPEERDRIERANGQVVSGRINGTLAVSRAFGDRQLKSIHIPVESSYKYPPADTSCQDIDGTPSDRMACTAVPYISITQLSTTDQFLIIGCDGLFDVMSPQSVVDWVHSRLESQRIKTAYLAKHYMHPPTLMGSMPSFRPSALLASNSRASSSGLPRLAPPSSLGVSSSFSTPRVSASYLAPPSGGTSAAPSTPSSTPAVSSRLPVGDTMIVGEEIDLSVYRKSETERGDIKEIAKDLTKQAIKLGTTDNVSVILAFFKFPFLQPSLSSSSSPSETTTSISSSSSSSSTSASRPRIAGSTRPLSATLHAPNAEAKVATSMSASFSSISSSSLAPTTSVPSTTHSAAWSNPGTYTTSIRITTSQSTSSSPPSTSTPLPINTSNGTRPLIASTTSPPTTSTSSGSSGIRRPLPPPRHPSSALASPHETALSPQPTPQQQQQPQTQSNRPRLVAVGSSRNIQR